MSKRQSLVRRMLRCGLVAAVLMVAARQASAEGVTVRGSPGCQEYLDAKARNNVQEAVKDLSWLLGYMSGLAVATQVNILGKDDGEGMLTWVDAYCQTYPARYLSNAGDLYYRFLKERMQAVGAAEKREVR